jgi:LysR family glycine cleavage system transcriptional activator
MDPADPLPPLNQLRVFEAAARLGSFTQAGRELHLTQSAVSQQVRALETYVGRPLFYRRPRAVELTAAGRTYLPIVQRSLDALAAGTVTVFGRRDQERVTVQLNLSLAIFWLTPRLPDFVTHHPDVTIELVTGLFDPEPAVAPADVEIRFADDVAGATRLCRNRCYPVCAPDRVDVADWRTDTLFDTTGVQVGWRTWLTEQGEVLPADQRIHVASTYAVGMAAAMLGDTLAMAMDTFADPAIAAGRLVRPFAHVSEAPESYWLVHPRPGQRSHAAAEAFRAWLSEQASPESTH